MLTQGAQQLSQDPQLMGIYQRGVVDFNSISELEKGRFHMTVSNLFTKYQLMAQLEKRGFIDSDMHKEQYQGIEELLKLPGMQQWWASAEHWYGPTFREFIAEQILPSDPQ